MKPRRYLNGLDRVSAQLEEMIRYPNAIGVQYRLPHIGKRPLGFIAGSYVRAAGQCVSFRDGQSLAVDFVVRRERHPRKLNKMRRNHVIRQFLRQRASQLAERKRVARDQVSAQFLSTFAFPRDYDRLLHGVDLQKLLFNLADLDPESTDFHLMIDPAQVLNISVRQPAGEISRPVKAFSRRKRMFHELLCRQLRMVQVTSRKPHACHTQLAVHSRWHKLQVGIQNKNPVIGQRAPDRNDSALRLLLICIPKRRNNRSFGRAVSIEIVDLRFPLLHEFGRYRRASRYELR